MRARAAALLLALAPAAGAHELKTVGLWLDEVASGRIEVRLEVPLSAEGVAAAVVPRFDPSCRAAGPVRSEREPGSVRRSFTLECRAPLAGQRLALEGLDPRVPDAVVVARFAGGGESTLALDRHAPEVLLGAGLAPALALRAYLGLGVEHILGGADHLLFVLGLVLAVAAGGFGARRLVLAVSAFTLAHSLTLALSALGVWGLPPRVTELLIALSVVTLALELARHAADPGAPRTLALRHPAAIAFAFGLLHGFGFAGALAGVGLPEQARLWALLLFNLGVELGQLAFIAALLAVGALIRRLPLRLPSAPGALATALGGIATCWTLERLIDWSAALTRPLS